MKKEIADKWIDALRSGNYKQGRAVLGKKVLAPTPEISYCCLGVLCELAIKEGIGIVKEDGGDIIYIAYDGEQYHLPISVKEWSGMYSVQGRYTDYNTSETLAEKNDSGYTFEEIADIIENHWEEL